MVNGVQGGLKGNGGKQLLSPNVTGPSLMGKDPALLAVSSPKVQRPLLGEKEFLWVLKGA